MSSPTAAVPETLHVEFEREEDGRWIAEIPDLPGVMVYGASQEEAFERAKALALRVLADRIEGQLHPASPNEFKFVA